jgi:hypothetical protein
MAPKLKKFLAFVIFKNYAASGSKIMLLLGQDEFWRFLNVLSIVN